MRSFEYNTPTHVVFGKDSVEKVGALVAEQGCKKVLIHYGGGSAKRSGLLDRVSQSLDASGVAYVMLGGVVPNPRLSLVREGIDLCRKEGVDFILAVGGGSPRQSATVSPIPVTFGIIISRKRYQPPARRSVPS